MITKLTLSSMMRSIVVAGLHLKADYQPYPKQQVSPYEQSRRIKKAVFRRLVRKRIALENHHRSQQNNYHQLEIYK